MSATLLPTPESSTVAEPVPVSILCVDDRAENLLALEAILEPLDARLVRAYSGPEALKAILQQEFAVILLDVQMPGMNGFETAQLIKSRERSRTIPIIFLTAINKEEQHVFRGYEVGAVDYMSKPFQPDILRSKVQVFVDLFRKQVQLARQDQQLRDAERREVELRHRADILEREAVTAEIVGSAMDAIVTFDDARRVTLFNAAAQRMFCVRADDALVAPADAHVPRLAEAGYLESLGAHGAPAAGDAACVAEPDTAAPKPLALEGRRTDGTTFPLEASISRLEMGGRTTYTMIARDVTERHRAEEALRTQAESLARSTGELEALNRVLRERSAELEQAMNARNRFYASMSHELRTPINAVIGYTTLLLDHIYGPLTEKQTTGLQRTHKAAKHLLELVNDVLDLSKIEAGKIELALQPVVPRALVDELFVTVRPMADEHGSTLALQAPDDMPPVVTDPRRVRQILLNLLSNAIKFGLGKPIEVECRATAEGGVEILVRDQGIGIGPGDLPRVFDEFVQLDEHAHQSAGGTGLGLPISRRLAHLLNGSLDVESELGKGSTFRLTLPARVS